MHLCMSGLPERGRICFPKPCSEDPKFSCQLSSLSMKLRTTLLNSFECVWETNLGGFWAPPWECRPEKSDHFGYRSGCWVCLYSPRVLGSTFRALLGACWQPSGQLTLCLLIPCRSKTYAFLRVVVANKDPCCRQTCAKPGNNSFYCLFFIKTRN